MGTPAGAAAPGKPELWLPPKVLSVNDFYGSAQLITGWGLIIAASISGRTATVITQCILYDGTDNSGNVLCSLAAPAASGAQIEPAPPGIPYRQGIYAYHGAGLMFLSVTVLPRLIPWE